MRSLRLLRWLNRTPVQTFILCPLLVVAFELVRQRGRLAIVPAGFALLALGISAISAGRAFAHSTRRRRSRPWRAAGSDRGGRALSLRAQPDVSPAPDFHAGLGVDVRLVVCADPVRRSRALVSPPCARGRNAPAGNVWSGLPRLSAAGEALDPRSVVNGGA